MLTRGARLCESIIRTSRPHKGGARVVGRPYLARRLGCSVRTVSRYIAELRTAERVAVTPPRRQKTGKGWRCTGVNTYRLTCPSDPAPHVTGPARLRRSGRGDTRVTPSPTGTVTGADVGPPSPSRPANMTAIEGLAYLSTLLGAT